MIRNISIGIEVGSAKTRVVVGEIIKGEKNPKVIGIGESETVGVRHGCVMNPTQVTESIKTAKEIAEKTSGVKIKKAVVSIGGTTLLSMISTGETIISKADGEITTLDIENALDDSENNLNFNNKKILKIFPISFKLDGKEILGRPEGMKGTKLEIKTIFVTCSSQCFENLMEAITLAGIEPINIVPSPLSIGNIVLSQKQKIVGTALVDIGMETVTLGVFENETIIYLHSFSIGSSDITNDIALGMKVSLEKAEEMKLGKIESDQSKKKLDEIIEARLSDIFEIIENNLKKIKRSGLLPAGVVFVGGGANIQNLSELSTVFLKLPSRIGTTDIFNSNIKTKLRDPSWFSVLGLLNYSEDDYNKIGNSFNNLLASVGDTIKKGIKQLLP
ncbi:MAG: cell division protein FtsA [Candidatus Paceibacterota bacterium]